MSNPDFVTLAKSMGVHAIRCDNAADLPAKMKEFMEYDNSRPVLLDACIIEVRRKTDRRSSLQACSSPSLFLQTETVCPQVLPGKALHDMVMHRSLVSFDSRGTTMTVCAYAYCHRRNRWTWRTTRRACVMTFCTYSFLHRPHAFVHIVASC